MTQFVSVRALHQKWMTEPDYARLWEEQDLPWSIATKLATSRWAADLTQADIAERMGTTQSVVARMENGRHLPSLRSIERYAEALGLTVKIDLVAPD